MCSVVSKHILIRKCKNPTLISALRYKGVGRQWSFPSNSLNEADKLMDPKLAKPYPILHHQSSNCSYAKSWSSPLGKTPRAGSIDPVRCPSRRQRGLNTLIANVALQAVAQMTGLCICVSVRNTDIMYIDMSPDRRSP